jgi:hypothetical protein
MHDPIQTTIAANAATPNQNPASLSELQEIVKQFEKMEPVDDVLWMNKATFESLLEQLDVKLAKAPIPGEEYFTLTDLARVQIHLDENLAARVVESGSYERNPRLPGYSPRNMKIVRHRYTI